MFKAIRIIGSRNLPVTQDASGALVVAQGNAPAPVVTSDNPLIYPAVASVGTHKAVASPADYTTADGVKITVQYVGNLGDSVEIVGHSSGAGSDRDGIYRSVDNGETWTRLSSVLDMPRGILRSSGEVVFNIIAVGGSARATEIWATSTLDSHHAANWTKVAEAASGYFSAAYGASIRGNVVLFASYGDKDAANPPRHLYLSRNYGRTFQEIEVRSISAMPNPATFHLHDCEYDPYADRIWVSNGDLPNSAIQYSDDWGVSWVVVDTSALSYYLQPTNIVALADRVLFCTDDKPDGVKGWLRDLKKPNQAVNPLDIVQLYEIDRSGPAGGLAHVANNSNTRTDSQLDVFPNMLTLLMNQASTPNGKGKVVVSPDGAQFYTLLSLEGRDVVMGGVYGPCSNDPHRQVIVGFYDKSDATNYRMKFRFPEWVIGR